jgi:hypothetical protein
MREMPDQISGLPRTTWLMGVLSALAGIEAAFTGARVCSQVMQGSFARTFHATAGRLALDTKRRWELQFDQMLERHPWISVENIRVELIGLETKNPRFRIAGCRREELIECATSQRP